MLKSLLAGVLISFPLWAAEMPTAAQIAACAPDAVRLCPLEAAAGDHAGVKACMLRHKAQLSAQCREAFPK